MKKEITLSIIAVLSGVLLTLMIMNNSYLSTFTSPLQASWITHGIGSIAAFLIWGIARRRTILADKRYKKIPIWCYFGGLPGAFTVLLAAITVNSPLSLSGSIVLMLTGQIVTGLLMDHVGLLGLTKRKITKRDSLTVLLLLLGSILIIMGR
ncbi:DMT family transporter [Citrobacter freundii]|uniref:DMT family transporter n=1 Tax=Citrobacter freundii TaxID=546 RepID=UPI0015F77CE9|nr:DMT family transporter [Citrobacter freundii]HEE0107142.1 DMT family transporter [Citrobacter gillenii]HEE0117931.1 DMT family transporter [Citrobacter gillenii]